METEQTVLSRRNASPAKYNHLLALTPQLQHADAPMHGQFWIPSSQSWSCRHRLPSASQPARNPSLNPFLHGTTEESRRGKRQQDHVPRALAASDCRALVVCLPGTVASEVLLLGLHAGSTVQAGHICAVRLANHMPNNLAVYCNCVCLMHARLAYSWCDQALSALRCNCRVTTICQLAFCLSAATNCSQMPAPSICTVVTVHAAVYLQAARQPDSSRS